MERILSSVLVLAAWMLYPSTVAGQPPSRPTTRNLLADMQSYAQALGVTCEYCHVAPVNSGLPQPKKDIARTMIAIRLPFVLSAICGLALLWWMLARLVSRRHQLRNPQGLSRPCMSGRSVLAPGTTKKPPVGSMPSPGCGTRAGASGAG